MTLASGTKLGPYEVQGLLGAGGMGEVYRARDSRLGREVAVKVLPRAMAGDPERQHRFEAEARAAGALNHANIVTLHDVGIADGTPYIVTEILEGESLRAFIERGPVPARRAIELITQLASGLSAAHAKGIVHRDLKPENLFLLSDGRLKILDFGIAKLMRTEEASQAETTPVFASLTVAGTIMGTVSYMAPEQLRDRPVDQRADLFAVGAILHEMLTGKQPFSGETAADRVSAILSMDPPPLPESAERDVPGIGAVVSRLLAKRPEQRLDTAADLGFVLTVLGGRRAASPLPETAPTENLVDYRQLSFRDGEIGNARFAPDGQTVVYDASWGGKKSEVFVTRIEYPGTTSLGLENAIVQGVSSTAEIAVTLDVKDVGGFVNLGRLARGPLVGGRPRELADSVFAADWHPDGRSLAAIRFVGSEFQIEAPLGRAIHKTHAWISHLRYSPDGSMLAFLEHPTLGNNAGYVCVMRPGEVPRRISEEYETLWRMAWRPDGQEIWFGGEGKAGQIGIYGVTLDGKLRRVLSVPGWAVVEDITKNGDALVHLNRPRMHLEFAERSRGLDSAKDLSNLDWSLLRDMTPDGSTILMDETGPGSGGIPGVYVRATDGTPAFHVAEGTCMSMTPDGKWILAKSSGPSHHLNIVPTGLGESRSIDLGEMVVQYAHFLPGAEAALMIASRGGGARHLHRVDFASERITAVDDALEISSVSFHVSHDGQRAALRDVEGRVRIVELADGSNRLVPGLDTDTVSAGFAGDSRYLYVWRRSEIPARVRRIQVDTGESEPWVEIQPVVRGGVSGINALRFSADGERYAYCYVAIDSTLFLARGLR